MSVLLRIVLTVAGTLAGTILWISGGGSHDVGSAAYRVVLGQTLPLLALTTLVLWPAELVLSRFGRQAAITIVAPVLGVFVPYALVFIAPNYENAMHGIALRPMTGLACGIAWAISLLICGLCRPRLRPS
jgi:hypothetical protein